MKQHRAREAARFPGLAFPGVPAMRFEELQARVRGLRQVGAWRQMGELVERAVHREGSVWEYPSAACRAVGGSEQMAVPAAAAVFCSVASIRLVDDILDDDPRGDYRILGAGQAANLSLAFQAAGHLLLDDPGIPPQIRARLQASFADMSLATCFGQNLDAREAEGEEEYWRIVDSKTPPLFGEALRMGALLGGAPADTIEGLACLGRLLGRFIQVSDDLTDSLETPARADWQRRGNNLAILYAMTAPHPDREEFLRLSTAVEDPDVLAAAQKILLRSGAVSYCTLKLIEFSREIHRLLDGLSLQDPEPVARLVELHQRPLQRLLESVGVKDPASLSF
jgi:geranylgeranyl pyrophosphate synthase